MDLGWVWSQFGRWGGLSPQGPEQPCPVLAWWTVGVGAEHALEVGVGMASRTSGRVRTHTSSSVARATGSSGGGQTAGYGADSVRRTSAGVPSTTWFGVNGVLERMRGQRTRSVSLVRGTAHI